MSRWTLEKIAYYSNKISIATWTEAIFPMYEFHVVLKPIFYREKGDNGMFNTLVPKIYNNVFVFVGLTTLRTLVNLIG